MLLSNRNSAAAQNLMCFFLLLENFLQNVLKILISKQKICSSTKKYRIMNHFEYFWAPFFVVILNVNIFSHIFYHFMGRRDFLGYYVTKIRAETRHFSILLNLLWMAISANSAILCLQQIFAMAVTERSESTQTALEDSGTDDVSVPKAPVSKLITLFSLIVVINLLNRYDMQHWCLECWKVLDQQR